MACPYCQRNPEHTNVTIYRKPNYLTELATHNLNTIYTNLSLNGNVWAVLKKIVIFFKERIRKIGQIFGILNQGGRRGVNNFISHYAPSTPEATHITYKYQTLKDHYAGDRDKVIYISSYYIFLIFVHWCFFMFFRDWPDIRPGWLSGIFKCVLLNRILYIDIYLWVK